MNQREKLLAGLVALSLLATVAIFGGKQVTRMLALREAQVAVLKKAITKKQAAIIKDKRARVELSVYENRSLSSDPVLATSHYRAWLHEWAEKCGIHEENVRYESVRRRRDQYNLFTFSMSCEGDLRNLVRLLHHFYSVDFLHRVRQMSIRPLKEKNKLSLVFRLEALSLPSAKKDKTLEELPSDRLAFKSIDPYYGVIVNRNPYSPANQPPRFVSTNRVTGYLKQPLTIRPETKDPESNRVQYRLGKVDLPGLRIDERSGSIQWTPEEKGQFEIPVIAIDDGLPPKETTTTIQVDVTDPPPPRKPDPPKPAFDTAGFAVVTGIVEVNGEPQVWIDNRTEGKLLKLKEGDAVEVGNFHGKIERIFPKRIEVRTDDKLLSIQYGQNLLQGQVISPGDQAQDVAKIGTQ